MGRDRELPLRNMGGRPPSCGGKACPSYPHLAWHEWGPFTLQCAHATQSHRDSHFESENECVSFIAKTEYGNA